MWTRVDEGGVANISFGSGSGEATLAGCEGDIQSTQDKIIDKDSINYPQMHFAFPSHEP